MLCFKFKSIKRVLCGALLIFLSKLKCVYFIQKLGSESLQVIEGSLLSSYSY